MSEPVSERHRLTPLITLEDLWHAGFSLRFIEDQAANEAFHWGKNDPSEPYSGVTVLFDADRYIRLGADSERADWMAVWGLEIELVDGAEKQEIG